MPANSVKISTCGSQNTILLIRIRGTLDTPVAYHLQEEVERLIEQGHRKFLVDLQELVYISSAGIGLFSAIILDLQRHHGRVVFIHLPESARNILKMTRLIEIFTIARDKESAIAALEAV